MGVHESCGILSRAAKELQIAWNEAKMNWRDTVADKFEEKYIAQLPNDLRQAQTAMDQASVLLQQIRRDCT